MAKKEGDKVLNVRLDKDSHRALRHLAAEADSSLKAYLENIIAEELHKRWPFHDGELMERLRKQ